MGGQLPSGTVTFLFADLVDNRDALADVVARLQGTVVPHQRDGLLAVFDDADAAVCAAVESQRARGGGARIGLCTGFVGESGGEYHGPVVDCAARVADIAQPGQILAAASTVALVRTFTWRDLGVHHLEGLAPTGVSEVLTDDLPSAEGTTEVDVARRCFVERRWDEAWAHLSAADEVAPLDGDDLQLLATAAYLTGREANSDDAWARGHEAWARAGDPVKAAQCAYWLAFGLMLRGDVAQGAGWLARAQRLVKDSGQECAVEGFLLVPAALHHLDSGEADAAFELFARAGAVGDRFGDADLTALARLGRGQALIAQGEITAGMALLDEVMVSVIAGEVGPVIAGIVYCAVLLECRGSFDVRRAREWTEALTKWCASQPDLVPYRGQCLVHRSELLQLGGEWPDALELARQACERLAGHPAIGEAYYQQAEVHRLRGEFPEAEAAYRSASQFGREPQPGLALLRLGQGQTDAAAASIRRVVDEAQTFTARSSSLGAYAEIMLAASDVGAARVAADELTTIARDHDAPLLRAVASWVEGAVLLAEGDARGALEALRRAWKLWQEVGAPYEAARVRVLIGVACRQLGDEEAGEMELDAARLAFEGLGAAPDLARLAPLLRRSERGLPGGLTAREAEVLALVAAGKTNREIAAALVVSEHTVRRHLQNIFAKIGVSSRAAATRYAFQHDLV